MTLDDLKNINLGDLRSWPLVVKIIGMAVTCVLIIFAGYWFLIQGELEDFDRAQRKEAELREAYVTKVALAINLAAYKQQMEEMQQTFGTLLRQLPNTTEVPDLLVDITQAGLGRGLEFVLFKPDREQPKDFYAELPVSVQVTGTYHELALFVSDVAALPRIVTFGDIDIAAADGNRLNMSAKARTYRYVEGGGQNKGVPARKGAK